MAGVGVGGGHEEGVGAEEVAVASFVHGEECGSVAFVGFEAAEACEGGGEAPEVILRPGGEGVVMALGALDGGAHEGLSDTTGELDGIGIEAEEEMDGSIFLRGAGGGEEFTDDLPVGFALGDGLGEVSLEEATVVRFTVDGSFAEEPGGDDGAPVAVEFRGGEEAIDEASAAVGTGVGEEGADFVNGGDVACEVESDAAEEGGIIDGGRGGLAGGGGDERFEI